MSDDAETDALWTQHVEDARESGNTVDDMDAANQSGQEQKDEG